VSLRSIARPLIERRAPLLANLYRVMRDEVRFLRQRPLMTPDGLYLAGNRAMQEGSFEPDEQQLLRERLREADVFIDVGANIGFFSCLARSMGKRVVAVEPVAATLRLLYSNLIANGWSDVEVWPMALAGGSGIVEIFGGETGASLLKGWAGISSVYRRRISSTTLDQILRGRFVNERLVVKIDVEGFEYSVLQGSPQTLAREPRPVWLVEITRDELRHETNPVYEETFEIFFRQEYDAFNVSSRGLIPARPADIARWARQGLPPGAGYNWLFRGRS